MHSHSRIRRLISILRPHSASIITLLLISIVRALLAGMGDPLVTKWLIDSISRRQFERFIIIAVVSLAVYTALRLINALSERWSEHLRVRAGGDLSIQLLDQFYRIPYGDVLRHDNAYFVSRIYDEALAISDGINIGIQMISSSVLLLGAAAVCLWLSWKVALLLTVIVPLLRYMASKYTKKIGGATIEEKEREAYIRQYIGRATEAYKTVKIFGFESQIRGRLQALIVERLKALDIRVRHSSSFRALSGMFLSYAEQAVMIGAGFEVIHGDLSIGGLFALLSAYSRVLRGFETVAGYVPAMGSLSGQIDRLEQWIQSTRSEAEPPSYLRILIKSGSYDIDGQPVLRGFNLEFRSGERILVTGPNGSGKSTLMHILNGFLDLCEGTIQRPSLPRMSSLLTPFSFVPGTARDNLNYGALSAEDKCRLDHLLGRFGLGDKQDDDPTLFSEGEKGKLQIVMALMKQADFYVFDEPLAHVDQVSGGLVMEEIFANTQGKGLIITMHGGEQYRSMFDREIRLNKDGVADDIEIAYVAER